MNSTFVYISRCRWLFQWIFAMVLLPMSLQGLDQRGADSGWTKIGRSIRPKLQVDNLRLHLPAKKFNQELTFVDLLPTSSKVTLPPHQFSSDRSLRVPRLVTRRHSQTRALLNNGNWKMPDITGVSETVMKAMQGILEKQSAPSSTAYTTTIQRKRQQEEAEKFVRAIEQELSQWIKQIGDAEDKRLAELNQSLDAVYEILNSKFSASGGASTFSQIRASLKAWRALRRSTDPSTKEFLLAMERIRSEYDSAVMTLTNTVQPLTEEEVRLSFERAGGRELQRAIEEGVDSAFTMQQALETALQKSLTPLSRQSGELDQELVVVRKGVQQAENMIRAGLERARYNVLQRTQRRDREPEAAYVRVHNGVVYASTTAGFEVPVLEGLGEMMYVDDTDGSSIFMGVKADVESSQHIVNLGVLPA